MADRMGGLAEAGEQAQRGVVGIECRTFDHQLLIEPGQFGFARSVAFIIDIE